jgi:hypothetical protein
MRRLFKSGSRRGFLSVALVLFCVFFASSYALSSPGVKYRNKREVPRISVDELKAKLSSGAIIFVLDIRTGASYDSSPYRIPGDVRSMFGELRERTKHIPRDAEIAVYCT